MESSPASPAILLPSRLLCCVPRLPTLASFQHLSMASGGSARGALPPLASSDQQYLAFVYTRNHWLKRLSSDNNNLICVVGEPLVGELVLPSALRGTISLHARAVSFSTARRPFLKVREAFATAGRRSMEMRERQLAAAAEVPPEEREEILRWRIPVDIWIPFTLSGGSSDLHANALHARLVGGKVTVTAFEPHGSDPFHEGQRLSPFFRMYTVASRAQASCSSSRAPTSLPAGARAVVTSRALAWAIAGAGCGAWPGWSSCP